VAHGESGELRRVSWTGTAGEEIEADSLCHLLDQIEDNDEIVTVTVLEGDPDGESGQAGNLHDPANHTDQRSIPHLQKSTRSRLEKMPRS
jgi:hypothetical protein